MRTECLCISVLRLGRAAVCDCGAPWTFLLPFFFIRVASGPWVKLVDCQSALSPRWSKLLTVLRRWPRCCSYSV